MDYDLWFRIAKKYDLGYLREYLAGSRMYRENKTLSKRVPVHREILEVVFRHHGAIPPSWVYGYAHAVLERRLDRSSPWQNYLFVLGLLIVSVKTFWRYNRRFPFAECRQWRKLLWQHLTRQMLFPFRGRRKKRPADREGFSRFEKRDG
jgi:hypothetical protein